MSSAAKAIGIAQPALSHQIAELERLVGLPLLERYPRGVRLTEHGRVLMEHASDILARIDKAEASMKQISSNSAAQTVTISLISSWAITYTPAIIAASNELLPDVSLRILEARNEESRRMVAANEADLCIVMLPPDAPAETKIVEESLFLVSKEKWRRDSVALGDLNGVPLILPSRNNLLRTTIDAAARTHDVTLDVAIEIDGQDTVKRVVLEGKYSSILSWNSIRSECKSGELWATAIVEPPLKRSIHLLKSPRTSKALWETFNRILCRIVSEDEAGKAMDIVSKYAID